MRNCDSDNSVTRFIARSSGLDREIAERSSLACYIKKVSISFTVSHNTSENVVFEIRQSCRGKKWQIVLFPFGRDSNETRFRREKCVHPTFLLDKFLH
jgi:hypothetical protein